MTSDDDPTPSPDGAAAAPEPSEQDRPEETSAAVGEVDPRRRAGVAARAISALAAWLRGSRLGLVALAVTVGVFAGFGAVGFRWLIFAITWLTTGYKQFGQQGRLPSAHLPWLGTWFLLLIPVVGGLVYGPLIQRFAREARGHGVPEVMAAVSENGGRIRPQVTLVKALASAICIGTGGSVGREGPIVQIGSAFASTFGQFIKMSETRLRILVACGAAGGIAATFNAPITGVFFGFELILRDFSLDALFATILSAVLADLVSRAFFGAAPFFAAFPHDLVVTHDYTYLLVAVLGLAAGAMGFGFKTVLYKAEDLLDAIWRGRPEWARPAVGGIALGALLVALPQLYGVGYPVVDRAVAGHEVLWLLAVLMVAKVVAASLTLAIGGSGGIFAPSLFAGAMGGMAFGLVVRDLFGPIVSSPAVFAVIAMGAVFGAASQAPLTAIASVVEMTANFTLILPVMLAVGVAVALSKRLSHGSIYTTKLLRRGIDIERPRVANVLRLLTVGDVMLTVEGAGDKPIGPVPDTGAPDPGKSDVALLTEVGRVVERGQSQALFEDETLDQALRQLVLFGRSGLPVLSPDAGHLSGWITRRNVLKVLADRLGSSEREAEQGRRVAESSTGSNGGGSAPQTPLEGYEIVTVTVDPRSPASGRRLDSVTWPAGSFVVATSENHELASPRAETVLRDGDRVVLLVPVAPRPPNPPEGPDRGSSP